MIVQSTAGVTKTMSFFEELKRRNVVRMAVLYGVSAWLLLQLTDVLSSLLPVPEWAGSLVIMLLILGFPLTLIVSWVYEMTPDGLKREQDVDRSISVTKETGRKINILIIALLVLAIATVAVDRLVPELEPVAESATTDEDRGTETNAMGVAPPVADPSVIAPDRSVAVLPFANRSARDDDIFFVDGIHDDILTQLARISSLSVISRTSVGKFRDTTQSMKEIGAILGVKNILEGGVQRAGDRVRINVQLIEVTTDRHLWAETYDRELTTANLFAIQSEISAAIAAALAAILTPEEKGQLEIAPTQNLAALEAFFLGRHALAKRTSASLAEAERHFRHAIELDPDYALAYVSLANSLVLQITYGGLSITEQTAMSEPLVDKAIAINDRLGEAFISKAYIATRTTMGSIDDPDAQEALFKKGIELAPGYATGHHWYAAFLSWEGRPEEARARLAQAARLDPLSSIIKNDLGMAFDSLGRFDEAHEQFESVIRLDPAFAVAYASLGGLEWSVYGRLDQAIVRLRKAVELDPGNPQYTTMLAALWSDLGGNSEADRILERMHAVGAGGPMPDMASAMVNLSRGDMNAAADNAEVVLAAMPNALVAIFILSFNDLQSGRLDSATERFRPAYATLIDDADPIVDDSNFNAAEFLAFILQSTGDDARAKLLLDRSMAVTQRMPRLGQRGYGIADVEIFAMQGKTTEALDALRQTVDEHWRFFWRFGLKHNPLLAALRDEPEFHAIIAELEADMATQLAHVREMEANGELAQIQD